MGAYIVVTGRKSQAKKNHMLPTNYLATGILEEFQEGHSVICSQFNLSEF